MVQKSEFRVTGDYVYDRSDPVLWILSHAWRHKLFLFIGLVGFLSYYITLSGSRIYIGKAAELILDPTSGSQLISVSLQVLALMVTSGGSALLASLCMEVLANRLERDSRHELYVSLLGKSQTFHDQQRVGDIMARATDDMRQLNFTISPGVLFISDMIMGFAVPMIFIAFVNWQLLLLPVLFTVAYVFMVRRYITRLDPVVMQQRIQHGVVNAGLEETISGIEIVKVAAQEDFERGKFRNNATAYRDLFVKQGQIEAGYLPLLVFGFVVGLFFLHSIILYNQDLLSVADIIAVMGLVGVLRFPVFVSLFSWSLLRMGVASAERIISLMNQETDIDENIGGHEATVDGVITFENVIFGYNSDHNVLDNISFEVQSGQTVAIVGQTGAGKSTITQLVGRTYDVTAGRVLVDNVDVREWNLDSLRSQIAKIEQDVFLFSRSIADNIAFGTPDATREQIEQAAKEAQAHNFILSFQEGYDTKIGERGVTLSGGQRQRLALARAFLKNPRILILDDSTSAIDSATEDEIQKAMKRAKEGRTTLLITHRLSQIRWADVILVLEKGQIVAKGSHEDLLRTSAHYRRIFARYDVNLPELQEAAAD
jgi:ATP-binding cassette subfamily B protein